jgi:hypothetical protein
MLVRQLDDLAVTLHVLQAGRAIAQVFFQFVLGILVQFPFNIFIEQLLRPPASGWMEQVVEEPGNCFLVHNG